MVRSSRVLLVLGLLAGACCAPRAFGQGVPSSSEPLPCLPVVPDLPRSLYAPPPPQPPPLCIEDDCYLEPDPKLDTPELPLPGFFVNAEIAPTWAAVRKEGINAPVTIFAPGGTTNTVAIPGHAALATTVVPRIEVGYRLPSGFGEVLCAFQSLSTSGSQYGVGPDGPAQLTSKLSIQMLDFDYASREMCLRPCWDMRWWFGMRAAVAYYSNEALESPAVAATGFGGFSQQTTNIWEGAGPHFGLEIARRDLWHGLGLVARTDAFFTLGRLHQGFFAEVQNPDGSLSSGYNRFGSSQSPFVLTSQVGLRWEPPELPHSFFFLGYVEQYWWYVMQRNNDDPNLSNNGEISTNGLWLRAEFNF